MSEVGRKQRQLVEMLGKLYTFAYASGYELTLGRGRVSPEANEADGGHEHSLHLIGLAQDLNLFRDGVYLTETEDHRQLGEFWESLGGSWGGRFNDGNHYSIEYRGMR